MLNQRWREGNESYRRPDEQIVTRHYSVEAIPDDTTAKSFVQQHHYSHSYPSAVHRFGLYEHAELVGVAVFSTPMSAGVTANWFNCPAVELGRFVLLDRVPGNGETWFLGQCFRELRKTEVGGVVSFSDPIPRTGQNGERVFPGHIGTIYQAHNATYAGRGTARTLRLLPDGTVLSERALSKIRSGEPGWVYSVGLLTQHGAPEPYCLSAGHPDTQELRAWVSTQLPRLTRTLRHPGNHRYLWSLRNKSYQPNPKDYPKCMVKL